MSDTQLAKQAPTLKAMLSQEKIIQQFRRALPKHLTAERFTRIALTTLTRVPMLAQCDQNSFFVALLDLSAMGLEPDGRKAYLIPFNNRKKGIVECQLIVSYIGLQDLVRRSGAVAEMHSDVVCENDEFDAGIKDGKLYLNWKPSFSDRGEVIGAFSAVILKNGGGLEWEFMPKSEIEAVRNQSQGKNAGPWANHWAEMARKTVFRRHAKRLPLSVEVQDAVERDDSIGMDLSKGAIAAESVMPSKPIDPFANAPEPKTEDTASLPL